MTPAPRDDGAQVRHHVVEDRSHAERTEAEVMAGMLGAQISEAVREGIARAAADPDIWAAAVAAIQVHAQREAGGWLFGGLRVLASRVMWIGLLALGVYMIGGWTAMVAFVKSGSHQ